MRSVSIWIWFVVMQVIMLIAAVFGWVLLIPFCALQAWVSTTSNNGRTIDRWSFGPLNLIYGNPEDGVSGQYALVWSAKGQQQPYLPNANPVWRAYLWSAWRNSADNLKYVFHRAGGPLVRIHIQIGWNTSGLPVFSVNRE